jgi:hypothetical protein
LSENKTWDIYKNFAIVLCIIGICLFGYFVIILPFINHSEGDPYFLFTEVPVNQTENRTVIHLEDQDILNIRGLDVRQENGKIADIYFRESQTKPEIGLYDFYQEYGSRMDDSSSRKYLEYKGVYYYAVLHIP